MGALILAMPGFMQGGAGYSMIRSDTRSRENIGDATSTRRLRKPKLDYSLINSDTRTRDDMDYSKKERRDKKKRRKGLSLIETSTKRKIMQQLDPHI